MTLLLAPPIILFPTWVCFYQGSWALSAVGSGTIGASGETRHATSFPWSDLDRRVPDYRGRSSHGGKHHHISFSSAGRGYIGMPCKAVSLSGAGIWEGVAISTLGLL